jgi:hypothetical protein
VDSCIAGPSSPFASTCGETAVAGRGSARYSRATASGFSRLEQPGVRRLKSALASLRTHLTSWGSFDLAGSRESFLAVFLSSSIGRSTPPKV